MTILAADIGTTALKMGVYEARGEALACRARTAHSYAIHTYNDGRFSEIEQAKWQDAFRAGCAALAEHLPEVDAVALSGTTPGLTAMDRDGNALYPAILMLDLRSGEQAQRIIETIGLDELLNTTGNMPVAGGCSLASMLWLKDNHPEVFARTAVFGHSNTFVARWLTGACAIDPSSASLTALYNTARNDMTWNRDIAGAFGLSPERLPPLLPAGESPGRLLPARAAELGLAREPAVVIGGNDAVLAAYSLGIAEPGAAVNVNGTCEITLVCLPRCIPSARYNVRAHVVPGRWLTLHVMNAGGKALDWFRGVFCSELDPAAFYEEFLPAALDRWLERASGVTYVPYLMGSRYSTEPLKASFTGLTEETSRDELLAAVVRALCEYQQEHLREIAGHVRLQDRIHVTGGAAGEALIRAKKRWMWPAQYVREEQSSLKGAALLGKKYLKGTG
jgi:sugar (pentulose or hexulose) kinase